MRQTLPASVRSQHASPPHVVRPSPRRWAEPSAPRRRLYAYAEDVRRACRLVAAAVAAGRLRRGSGVLREDPGRRLRRAAAHRAGAGQRRREQRVASEGAIRHGAGGAVAGMRAVSRTLNPECEHVDGDMRTVRLGRQFDAVFVHDAVVLHDHANPTCAWRSRPRSCTAGRAARRSLRPTTSARISGRPPTHGGPTTLSRGLRYLEWTSDPDPTDTTYVVDYAYLLRTPDGAVRVEHDRHVEGLFSRADWLRLLAEAGFEAACRALRAQRPRSRLARGAGGKAAETSCVPIGTVPASYGYPRAPMGTRR